MPAKVLKQLRDKTLLEWAVDRALKIHPAVGVVVLSGDRPENAVIGDWCKDNGVLWFQGSENDVLNRFAEAAAEFNAKTVLRLTADNPLMDFENAYSLILAHMAESAEYSSSKSEFDSGLPDGIGSEVFSADLLYALDSMDLSESHREHVNDYVLENREKFKCCHLGISQDLSKYSFTIDTMEDYERIDSWMAVVEPDEINRPDFWRAAVESDLKRNNEN